MQNVSVELRPYFRRVEKRLKCPRKQRRALLDKIRRAAEEFAAENPEASPEEAAEYLGDPDEVAHSLLEDIEPKALEQFEKRKKICIGILVAVLLAVGAVLTKWVVHLEQEPEPVEVTEKLVIYEEVEIP